MSAKSAVSAPSPAFHVIACEVFRFELTMLCAQMPLAPQVHFLPQGLHDTPDLLTKEMNSAIAALEGAGVTEIRLCYGLCGRGISGVRAKKARLIVPRVHDCIALLMGQNVNDGASNIADGTADEHSASSDESVISRDGSVFWSSIGWLKYSQVPFLEQKEVRRKDYTERFGEDSAAYLMEMEDAWLKEYKSATLIHWQGVGALDTLLQEAERVAEQANLPLKSYEGNPQFLRAFLGEAPENDSRFCQIFVGQYLDIAADGSLCIMGEAACV